MDLTQFVVPTDRKIRLKDHPAGYVGEFKSKEVAEQQLNRELKKLRPLQDMQIGRLRLPWFSKRLSM